MPQRHCGCRGMRRRLWNEDTAYICTPVSAIAIAGRSVRSRSVEWGVLAPFIGTRRRERGPQRHEARWQLSLVTRSSESKALDYQIGVHCEQRTGIKTSLRQRTPGTGTPYVSRSKPNLDHVSRPSVHPLWSMFFIQSVATGLYYSSYKTESRYVNNLGRYKANPLFDGNRLGMLRGGL